MADQLCIFVENRPGKLEAISKALSDGRINLRGISMASAGEFGVVRIIADDPDRAHRVLRAARFTVSRRRIVVALIEDVPGSLHRVLELLSSRSINIEDCYGIVLGEGRQAAVVLEVEKFPEAEQVLQAAGVELLSDERIYSI